ncbi:MAG: hypothetical protein LC774_13930 [Acidobacteria bacterium]|nr:hypothetical protein [Acidobacteriota bacterium]
MRTTQQQPRNHSARAGERGAALITMLLVSALILAAGGALIISTATSATNAFDSTTEKQAFYAAESGLQMALAAMRGNTPRGGTVAAGTKMSLRTAIIPSLSNGNADNVPCGTADGAWEVINPRCGLTGWLPYTATAPYQGANVPAVPVDPSQPRQAHAHLHRRHDPHHDHLQSAHDRHGLERLSVSRLEFGQFHHHQVERPPVRPARRRDREVSSDD